MKMYMLKCERLSVCVWGGGWVRLSDASPQNYQSCRGRKTITTKCSCFLSFIFWCGTMEGRRGKNNLRAQKGKERRRDDVGGSASWSMSVTFVYLTTFPLWLCGTKRHRLLRLLHGSSRTHSNVHAVTFTQTLHASSYNCFGNIEPLLPAVLVKVCCHFSSFLCCLCVFRISLLKHHYRI